MVKIFKPFHFHITKLETNLMLYLHLPGYFVCHIMMMLIKKFTFVRILPGNRKMKNQIFNIKAQQRWYVRIHIRILYRFHVICRCTSYAYDETTISNSSTYIRVYDRYSCLFSALDATPFSLWIETVLNNMFCGSCGLCNIFG